MPQNKKIYLKKLYHLWMEPPKSLMIKILIFFDKLKKPVNNLYNYAKMYFYSRWKPD